LKESHLSSSKHTTDRLPPLPLHEGQGNNPLHDVSTWERNNSCLLPEDLKQFYLNFDGVDLSWGAAVGIKNLKIGKININGLDQLLFVSTDYTSAYVLNSQIDVGDILLVYTGGDDKGGEINTEIWFRDVSLDWHYLCADFTCLLRIMATHLGINGWQLAFTPSGLSAATQAWMSMYCKERLCIDLMENIPLNP